MGDEKPVVETDPADVTAIGRDPAALEVFYRRHVADVTRFVARRISDPHTVDDLTTEVFLAAIDAAERYQVGRGTPRAWLLGIARNVVAAEWRRHSGELDKAQRAGGHRHLDGDDIVRLEEQIDAERAARDLYGTLSVLPRRLRSVIELVDLDGLPLAEAAAALGIRDGTARVRLHRARRRLKAAVPPDYATPARSTANSPSPLAKGASS
ncbi:sigma-70 family RNA polymerase sigma factor [Actinomadura spongiicola]|uniref:Sigma-70 family RNA polymerase sigma factor n=1 Tax=Actinomadura spongiicola TaxID=2303421 RepID=A0A372GAZ5_9ACTN|nr:sigma-70 family RNA polymerase sigma factor [Actinomadura spongiicola]RFS82263.1 sigma-70 family RNA polymerase sigma factor [Actinomadura spongiicola]